MLGVEKKYRYVGNMNAAEDIKVFLDGFLNGELNPIVKSEPISPEDTSDSVIIVKANSFQELVLNNPKDVFIYMYDPQ